MTRRCSHCSNNGHNSRTCQTRGGGGGGGGLKLFGVRLTDGSIKKSASMGNLSAHFYSSASPNPSSPDHHHLRDPNPIAEGYVSDDPAHTSCSSNFRGERKKGVPWTEEEHRLFLLGLQKLGKGDWRGIARNFVVSRTPTQVASHAQKYFIRQSNTTRRKRRSSLFDMASDMHTDVPTTPTTPKVPEEQFLPASEACQSDNLKSLPSLHLSLERDCDHMETTCNETPAVEAEETGEACGNLSTPIPVFLPTYLPVAFPFWQLNLPQNGEVKCKETSNHQVVKPTPVLSKDRTNVDELLGMSKLTLGTGTGPSPLTLELLGAPSRQSAFHANHPPGNGSDLSSSKSNAIHAL